MQSNQIYDVAIVGGGLAGLALSIQLARAGTSVILYEKERYPFHRVCGEYISLESWNFLENLGYPLSDLELPIIKKLRVTSPGGQSFEHELPLGGFGISRYKIDADLARIARNSGVNIQEESKVTDVVFQNEFFVVRGNGFETSARVVAGSFGKRSNLDIKWKRPFVTERPGKLDNFIGVKYHIKADIPPDSIALHNFSNGYCGVSRVENGVSCLCYLTTGRNLKKAGSIREMERTILSGNPYLKRLFAESAFCWDEPVTISSISFAPKSQVTGHVLMLGDSAGMISPLCGNGMSMALHSSKIAAVQIGRFLNNEINREAMEEFYASEWRHTFRKRLFTGRLIQRFFGGETLTNIFVRTVKPFPTFISFLVRQTHGEPF